jgi:2-methylcitrate dehydratase
VLSRNVGVLFNTSADQVALFNFRLVRYADLLDTCKSRSSLCHSSFGTVVAVAEQSGPSGDNSSLALAVAYELQCGFTAVIPVICFNQTLDGAVHPQ